MNRIWKIGYDSPSEATVDLGVLASDAERNTTVEQLRVAGEEGRLSIEGLEWRVQRALEATHRPELDRLVRDLPEPPKPDLPEPPKPERSVNLDVQRVPRSWEGSLGNWVVGLVMSLIPAWFLLDPSGAFNTIKALIRGIVGGLGA